MGARQLGCWGVRGVIYGGVAMVAQEELKGQWVGVWVRGS